ncbi:hypothetical protein TNCV_2629621 [Trichonephila clavipes]|uniref:Uncharacterized protein n=1 Tax=Trichonephila clavipes TaxID=2585209 RepID=A0A8X6VJS9_TRICX|nr:hypothetical protein TNCV_2629621 [Trichonephila clavipes]
MCATEGKNSIEVACPRLASPRLRLRSRLELEDFFGCKNRRHCDSTKTHSQARDINMYNLFTEHFNKQSYIQSPFMPSPPVGTLKTGHPHVLSRRVYPDRRGTGF